MNNDKEIFLSGIIHDTIVDGPGIRTTIYMSGCNHYCVGCHNKKTWNEKSGQVWTVDKIINNIKKDPTDYGITISGGDPFFNEKNLLILLKSLVNNFPDKEILVYTGYKIDELTNVTHRLCLEYIDILIDGKFIIDEFDPTLLFKGSRNQRIIDVKKYLYNKEDYIITEFN